MMTYSTIVITLTFSPGPCHKTWIQVTKVDADLTVFVEVIFGYRVNLQTLYEIFCGTSYRTQSQEQSRLCLFCLYCACDVVAYNGFTLHLPLYRQGTIRQCKRGHMLQKTKAPARMQCSKEGSAANKLKTRKRARHTLHITMQVGSKRHQHITLVTASSQASPSLWVSGDYSHLHSCSF